MSDRYANSSDIIPQVKKYKLYINHYFIKETLTGILTTLKNLEKSLNSRYQKYLDQNNCVFATFLDPRYKQMAFKEEQANSSSNVENIELALIEDYLKIEAINKTNQAASVAPSVDNDIEEAADYEGFSNTNFLQIIISFFWLEPFDQKGATQPTRRQMQVHLLIIPL